MHRIYWVLFTILCASVVSVPSSQRFNSRPRRIGRDLSRLRTLRRQLAFGASRNKHASSHVDSEKNFPEDRFAEIYKDGSEMFLNPRHLQGKIETLTDTDEHFVDYGNDETYDHDQDQDSENHKEDDIYYEDSFDSDPASIHIVGQSTEAGHFLGDVNEYNEYDEHSDDEENFDSDTNSIHDGVHSIESEQFFDEDEDESIGTDPDSVHLSGQSVEADHAFDGSEEIEHHDEESSHHLDPETHVTRLYTGPEEVYDSDGDEYSEERGTLEMDPNSIHITGQSVISEEAFNDNSEYVEDEEEDESTDMNPSSIHTIKSSLSEQFYDEDNDYDQYDEDQENSDQSNIYITRQSADSEHELEENDLNDGYDLDNAYDTNYEGTDSDLDSIHILGQSTESEQANETDFRSHGEEENIDEDEADHELVDEEDMEYEQLGDLGDITLRGQALLLDDFESDRTELEPVADEAQQGWAEDELYEPLDDSEVAHYEDTGVEEGPVEEDLAVDGMSYDDEPPSQRNYIQGDEADYGDDLNEFHGEDDERSENIDHDYELSEEESQRNAAAIEYNYDEDVEAFENELSSLEHQDQVNGQSALGDDYASSYSLSMHQSLDSEYTEENDFDDEHENDDENELDGHVGVSRTTMSIDSEDDGYHPDEDEDNDVYLIDDDDIVGEDHQYFGSFNSQTSEHSDDSQRMERFADGAQDEDLSSEWDHVSGDTLYDESRSTIDDEKNNMHVDGFAVVHEAKPNVKYEVLESSDFTSDTDEIVSRVFNSDDEEHDVAQEEIYDVGTVSQDQDDYIDEDDQSSRFESDDFEEDVTDRANMLEDLEDDLEDDLEGDLEGDNNGEWDEYLLDLALNREEYDMNELDTIQSSQHEVLDAPNSRWSDAKRASYERSGRYELEEGFDIASHSHDMLHGAMKSIVV
eukprot:gb/GEZJ01002283.1/.p1 GENE.gb/GEZJ01002283.1/~~gb/GEZJ01002283.1/.p1  ORF type:complete len:920 (-),score=230.84 gb/GEZJ01002283.1/:1360-4119(-)